MGSPSSNASECNASSHRANTIAWRHTSKPRLDGSTRTCANPGANAAAQSARNMSWQSSDSGNPSMDTSRFQKLNHRNHPPHAPTPLTNITRSPTFL